MDIQTGLFLFLLALVIMIFDMMIGDPNVKRVRWQRKVKK